MFIISSFAFLIVVTLLFKAAPSHRKQFTTCQIYKTVVFFMENTHTEHLVYTVINNTVITKSVNNVLLINQHQQKLQLLKCH
jgi:hypothetical protein